MSQCQRCLMPEGNQVILDENRICNYCIFYDKYREKFSRYDNLKSQLEERFNRVKGMYKYDAMVGISGGKDSAYVLFKLIEDYNLNVLTYTFDNGFLTDYAKKNIETLTNHFSIEHTYLYPNWDIYRKLYQAAFEKLGEPCAACDRPGYSLAFESCRQKKIPFLVHGRSPYQMFRNFYEGSSDYYLPIMEANLGEHSFEKFKPLYTEFYEQTKSFIEHVLSDSQTVNAVFKEFALEPTHLTDEFIPEFLAFFMFEPYNEEQIKSTLERETGYQRPPHDTALSHADCKIHDVSAHIYCQKRKYPLILPELAVMLRQGEITKAEAEKILTATELRPEALQQSIKDLCEGMGITEEAFHQRVSELREVTDYSGYIW